MFLFCSYFVKNQKFTHGQSDITIHLSILWFSFQQVGWPLRKLRGVELDC